MVNYYYVYIYTNEHICNVKFLFMAVFVWIRKKIRSIYIRGNSSLPKVKSESFINYDHAIEDKKKKTTYVINRKKMFEIEWVDMESVPCYMYINHNRKAYSIKMSQPGIWQNRQNVEIRRLTRYIIFDIQNRVQQPLYFYFYNTW